jgi:hypothetical protein
VTHPREPVGEQEEKAMTLTEKRIRDGIAKLELSILHHEQERDGWRPDDECYQKLVGEVVADLLHAASEGTK